MQQMPRSMSRCGSIPEMSSPRKWTLPLFGGRKPQIGLDERRLAGAVEADQPGDPAGVDAQVDLAQDVDVLRVSGSHVTKLEERGGFAHRDSPLRPASSRPLVESPSALSPR
jgi:hypothetical protein